LFSIGAKIDDRLILKITASTGKKMVTTTYAFLQMKCQLAPLKESLA
jgi:hypothetical protein